MRSTSAGRDPGAARPPDDVAELLAGPPDRRRVDDGQELLEVLGQQPVEQRRVAVLERGEADVLLERVGLDAQVLELELDLLLDGQDAVGQQAAQAEGLALVGREGEVLGQQPAAEQRRAGQGDACRAAGGDVVERGGQRAHRRPSICRWTRPPVIHRPSTSSLNMWMIFPHPTRNSWTPCCGAQRSAPIVRPARRGRRQPSPVQQADRRTRITGLPPPAARMGGWLGRR